jgi:Protein of unknown function (DUF3738)
MGELASVMQRALLDRPVLDRTGLTGRYDFDLEFMPDESQFGGRWASQGSRPIMTLRPASLRRFNNNSACNWKRQRGQLLRWLSIALNVHRLTDRAVFQTPAARRLVINNKTNRAEVSPTFLSSAVSQ